MAINKIIDNKILEKAALDGKRERENVDEQEMEIRKAAEIANFDQIILSQYIKANECKQERDQVQVAMQTKIEQNEIHKDERTRHNELIALEIVADRSMMAAMISKRQKSVKDKKFF